MELTLTPSAVLPALPPTPSDFDYGAFLEDDEMDYAAGDDNTYSTSLSDSSTHRKHSLSSASSRAAGSESTASGSASGQQQVARRSGGGSTTTPAQRQRLERRGHTKSRRGCFNCKRRRIKCQETRPACGHCVKTGLKCEYPAVPQVTHQPHHQIPLFSLQDMRFFQHFLVQCYPHHPLGNENIWTHEIPCLSQSYEFLMHAILGLAASDLMQHDASLVHAAMAHRVKAIKAIKKALAEMPKSQNTYEEANALVATCFALTFQSVTLDDGLAEYMTFIRGILIVGMQMWIKGVKPIFANIDGQDAQSLLAPHMEELPLIPGVWTDGAVTAIQGLRSLCTDQTEIEFQEHILDMAQHLYVSSFGAYKLLQKHYGWWMMLPHERFQKVIDPNNQVMLLLGSHWIALKQIMAFITEAEHNVAAKKPEPPPAVSDNNGGDGGMDPGIIRWLKHLNSQVDDEHRLYNTWPMWVAEQLERDVTFFGKSR